MGHPVLYYIHTFTQSSNPVISYSYCVISPRSFLQSGLSHLKARDCLVLPSNLTLFGEPVGAKLHGKHSMMTYDFVTQIALRNVVEIYGTFQSRSWRVWGHGVRGPRFRGPEGQEVEVPGGQSTQKTPPVVRASKHRRSTGSSAKTRKSQRSNCLQ